MSKTLWVKAKEIMEATGWNKFQMHKARTNGWVKFKKENGIWYDLRSVPNEFIKRQVA